MAIAAVQYGGDVTPLDELLTVLAAPYDDQPEFVHYAAPPQAHEMVCETFCGT
jgi:uncharacterized protein YdiU (UPF0061 family)